MSDEESDVETQEVCLNNKEDEAEKEKCNPYADRDMCSFCFGEIYLDGPAHVCDLNCSNDRR